MEIGNILTTTTGPRQRARKLCVMDEESSAMKKVIRRETERERRQEMAALYASLRSLLPLQYIKGKRSISDQMHEAANYIKDMKSKLSELQMQRDELKKTASISDNASNVQNSSTPNNSYRIMVNCCKHGIEVLVGHGFLNERQGSFPISSMLKELLVAGLNIISYVSTKSNSGFYYRIQCDVCDLTYVDVAELQERLSNVIKNSGY